MSSTPEPLRQYRDTIGAWGSLAPISPAPSSGDSAQLTANKPYYPARPPIGLRSSSLRGLAPQSPCSRPTSGSQSVSPYLSSPSAVPEVSQLSPTRHDLSHHASDDSTPLHQPLEQYHSASQSSKRSDHPLTDNDVVPFLHATEYPFPRQASPVPQRMDIDQYKFPPSSQHLAPPYSPDKLIARSQNSLFEGWNAFNNPNTPTLAPTAPSVDVSPISPSFHDALHCVQPGFRLPLEHDGSDQVHTPLQASPLGRRGSDTSPGTGHLPSWPNPSHHTVGRPRNIISAPASRMAAARLHSPARSSPLNPTQGVSRKSSGNASRRGSLADTSHDNPTSFWKPFMHSPGSNVSSGNTSSPAHIPTKLSMSPRKTALFGPKLGSSAPSPPPFEFKVPSLPSPKSVLPATTGEKPTAGLGLDLGTGPFHLSSITPKSSSSSTATVTTAAAPATKDKPPSTKPCKTQAALAEQELAGHILPPTFAEKYQLREELGSGGFGFVCTAIDVRTQTPVAVKFIRRHKINDPKKQMVGSEPIEAYILRKCDHPGVIKLLELYEDAKFFYLVQELHGDPWERGHTLLNEDTPDPSITGQSTPQLTMSQSSPTISTHTPPTPIDQWSPDVLGDRPIFGRRASHDLFEACEHNRFTEEQSKKIFGQIVDAVAYLHSKNIFHRDLKDENIVIDRNLTVKIIDFGSAVYKDVLQGTEPNEKFRGTMSYASPEIHKELPYRPGPVDVWALGIVLSVILTGMSPFPNAIHARNGQTKLKRPVSDGALDLLRQCFVTDPSNRITIKDIQRHPWLNSALTSAYDTPKRETKPRQVSDDALMFDSSKMDYSLVSRLPKVTIP